MVNTYFMGIGINYTGTPNALRGCIQDVENVSALVKRLYPSVIIYKLTDQTILKPTRLNILQTLTQILQRMVKDDVFILHYSGHGTFLRSRQSVESDGCDEFIVPLDFKVIKDDELNTLLSQHMKSGTKMFTLFDSCHSGTVLDLKLSYETPTRCIVNKNSVDPKGQVMSISGCLDHQTSADAYLNGKFQGAMTNSFLHNFDPQLTTVALVEKMKTYLKRLGFSQVPLLTTSANVRVGTKVFFNT